jgi:hypothetical protein
MDYQRYQQRKRCWLVFGRAFLTLAILGLLAIALYLWAHHQHASEIASQHVRKRRDVGPGDDQMWPPRENPTLGDGNPTRKALRKRMQHKRRQQKPKIKYSQSYLNNTDDTAFAWEAFHNHTDDDEKVRHKKHNRAQSVSVMSDKKYIYVTRYKCRPGGPAYYHRRGACAF